MAPADTSDSAPATKDRSSSKTKKVLVQQATTKGSVPCPPPRFNERRGKFRRGPFLEVGEPPGMLERLNRLDYLPLREPRLVARPVQGIAPAAKKVVWILPLATLDRKIPVSCSSIQQTVIEPRYWR